MKYRAEIDGLRCLAVVPVIFFHAGYSLFNGGFVGVDIFFVISGYLITTIISNELDRGVFSIVNFYERRARRILPALFVVIFTSILLAWFWLLPSDMESFLKSLIATVTFSSNFFFYKEVGYFDSTSELKPLLHTWSLSVEEQYYIFFPLLLGFMWRFGKAKVGCTIMVIALVSFLLAQWASITHPEFAFFLLPTRAWELLIGAFAAIYLSESRHKYPSNHTQYLSFLGLLFILISIFTYDKHTPFPGIYALLPALGAALVITYANNQNFVGRLLSYKPFVTIGLVSYSAYLWHQPILAFTRYRTDSSVSAIAMSVLILLTFGISFLTWRFIETPFRDKSKIKKSYIFLFSLLVSFLLIGFSITGLTTNGYQSRVDMLVQQLDNSKTDVNPHRKNCLSGSKVIRPADSCVIGDESNIIGALVGDSHADAISYAMGMAAAKADIGFKELTYSGCIHALDTYHLTKPNDRCKEYTKEVNEWILENSKIKTIVIASRWTLPLERTRFQNEEGGGESGELSDLTVANYDENKHLSVSDTPNQISKKINETISSYLKDGRRVVLVYPIPEAGWDVPDFLAKQRLFNGRSINNLSTSYDLFKVRNKKAYDTLNAIESNDNLIRVYPEKIFCNTYIKDRCIVQLDGKSLYYDNNHLSNFGAKFVAENIIQSINTH